MKLEDYDYEDELTSSYAPDHYWVVRHTRTQVYYIYV